MPTPVVSVVIPAFNAASTIACQLDALVTQGDAPPFEVVVADNRSTDATAEVAASYRGRLDIRVVAAHQRQGVNCARNVGIAAARGSIIVLLDADDRAAPGTLRALTRALEVTPTAGIAAGILSMHDPATFELERPQGYLPYAPGGFMAMRKSVYDTVGGFDEDFIGGHDEVDLCWRAQHAGFEIAIARDAHLERVERTTARDALRQFHRYGYTYVQLFAKHRDRGIMGSSPRQELTILKRVVKALPHLASEPEKRLNASRFLGWHIGRWRGNLRFRTWGPR